MKFTDPLPVIPRKQPPSSSWWADATAQVDRVTFAKLAQEEQDRIVGNTRFGGRKRIIDKFPRSQQ